MGYVPTELQNQVGSNQRSGQCWSGLFEQNSVNSTNVNDGLDTSVTPNL